MAVSKLLLRLLSLCLGVVFSLPVVFLILRRVWKVGVRRVFSWRPTHPRPTALNRKEWGEHEFVTTSDGVRLHYVTKGRGRLLLLLHGYPESWYTYRRLLPVLSEHFKVVALDLRGYGDSDKPTSLSAYSMHRLVLDVKEVVSGLGYNECVMVAHDWGANVAWHFVSKHSSLVEQLIVINMPHPLCFADNFTFKQLLKSWYMFAFQLPLLPELWVSLEDYKFFTDAVQHKTRKNAYTEEDLSVYIYYMSQPHAATASFNYYRNMLTNYKLKQNEKVKVPTHIIWGEDDVALSKELLKNTEKYVENVSYSFFPQCSHWVMADRPRELEHELRSILKLQ